MINTILQGDALELAKQLEDNSIHCIVLSPPYWGLRDYGTALWYGGNGECDHFNGPLASPKSTLQGYTGEHVKLATGGMPYKNICKKCGATRIDSQMGLEETPEQYIENMVVLFRELRRALRKDGTLWLNMGDSYAQSGGSRKDKEELERDAKRAKEKGYPTQAFSGYKGWDRATNTAVNGLKPKDLCGIPWRLALALQADGWYLRSDIIWSKPNPMPESVTDRPTKAHEYLFLLTKSPKYFYDAEAIKEPSIESDWMSRYDRVKDGNKSPLKGRSKYSFARTVKESPPPGKANQHRPDREDIEYNGMRNKRSVWTINSQPYSGAHFATFPPKLIEPCILAGSREGDTVLDPFNGSGTTGAVAIKHHRNYIGCELNPDYIRLTKKRLAQVQYVFPGINS